MARDFDVFFTETYAGTVQRLRDEGVAGVDASHAAQDAYVWAYARWWRFGRWGDPLARIRRRALRRADRQQPTSRSSAEGAPVPTVDATVIDSDRLADELESALEALPLQQRRAVHLHYRSGLTPAEAAAEMGVSEGAFDFHLSRARRSLTPRVLERLGRQSVAS